MLCLFLVGVFLFGLRHLVRHAWVPGHWVVKVSTGSPHYFLVGWLSLGSWQDGVFARVPRVVVVYGFVAKRGVCSCVCMYGLSVMCRADRVYAYRVQGDGDEQ